MKTKNFLFRILSLLFFIVSLQSCKKDPKPRIDKDEQPPQGGTPAELTRDSIFLYAKQTYLWYDQLPTYKEFQPRQYNSLQNELFKITQFPINSQTGKPYEYTGENYPKYSYIIDNQNPGGTVSAVSLEGEGFDFGFALTAIAENDVRIRYVEPGSPADEADLRRGIQVTAINGTAINGNTSDDFINDAFLMADMLLTIKSSGGNTVTIPLSQVSYTSNPVLKKKILTAGSKKVGYIAYLRFSDSTNSAGALKQAFDEFAAAGGINDLIIDIRYNGGGYVKTAEYLSNLIAPSSVNGKTMYIEHYNDLMRSGKADILSNQILTNANGDPIKVNGRTATYADLDFSEKENTYKFEKEGNLQSVKNVYFIITGSTASASELLINNLRPYLNVKLIGKQSYGKPVGFFPIIIDKYTVYLSNFQSRNANNEGSYFAGFEPDFEVEDDVSRDFGDPNELCLSKALAEISGGAVAANTKAVSGNKVMNASEIQVNNLGKDREFKGMIEDRIRLKE